MKQTAVEWLEEQTRTPEWHSLKRGDIVEQAKKMEKEQIMNAYGHGHNNGLMYAYKQNPIISRQQYYNETFKTE